MEGDLFRAEWFNMLVFTAAVVDSLLVLPSSYHDAVYWAHRTYLVHFDLSPLSDCTQR